MPIFHRRSSESGVPSSSAPAPFPTMKEDEDEKHSSVKGAMSKVKKGVKNVRRFASFSSMHTSPFSRNRRQSLSTSDADPSSLSPSSSLPFRQRTKSEYSSNASSTGSGSLPPSPSPSPRKSLLRKPKPYHFHTVTGGEQLFVAEHKQDVFSEDAKSPSLQADDIFVQHKIPEPIMEERAPELVEEPETMVHTPNTPPAAEPIVLETEEPEPEPIPVPVPAPAPAVVAPVPVDRVSIDAPPPSPPIVRSSSPSILDLDEDEEEDVCTKRDSCLRIAALVLPSIFLSPKVRLPVPISYPLIWWLSKGISYSTGFRLLA
ncbi:hypothetical protein CYLTODRAFT_419657 [Cylindrobasidium torrendii FP15055 ss-10]|uniref:Uncharacterized protein n=1 Tax=Cylindrobasidium torrendii FP15055 ss-10 TaxID=1314674 RepID=A0A0D7BKC0_9AGAR|nr:hypothetical protein CYLTODRAFT_419657 [Cylindrobasidium torrendii FP15055 ss-10]